MCVGVIDGILIWTEKPTQADCEISSFGPKKFFCGRKNKFGFNMQGVCDCKGHFMDVYIGHPGSTSDFLAFSTSILKHKLEQPGFWPPDLSFLVTMLMLTQNTWQHHSKVDQEQKIITIPFIHSCESKLSVLLECLFDVGEFLCRPLMSRLGIAKQTALVHCLCVLHNFCINEREGSIDKTTNHITDVPVLTNMDSLMLTLNGGVAVDDNPSAMNPNGTPDGLMGGGDHLDDDPVHLIFRRQDRIQNLPRDQLHELVANGDSRPTPVIWRK